MGKDSKDINLIYAASEGNIEEVRHFLKEGANVNFRDPENGRTPLHLAVNEMHVDCVKLLVESGANVKIKSKEEGKTPLHELAWGRQEDAQSEKEICEILLAAGADVNAENDIGATPLVYAITYERPWLVKRFLEAGAKTMLPNLKICQTLLEYTTSKTWFDQKAKDEILAIFDIE